MKYTIISMLMTALAGIGVTSASAQASDLDRRCQLSFESGQYDVCAARSSILPGPLSDLRGESETAHGSYWLVKYEHAPGSRERAALAELGATFLDYLPHHAYRIRLPAGRELPPNLPGVLWIGSVAPEWKLAPSLHGLLSDTAERPVVLPITIALNAGANVDGLLAQWRTIDGVHHGFRSTGARTDRIVLTIETQYLASILTVIAPHAEVAAIQPRKRMQYLNARAGWLHQSGTPDEQPVFDRGLFGCGQVIGVLDSGVDFSHCSFHDEMAGSPPVSDCADGAACTPGIPDFLQRKVAHYYKWSTNDDALGDAACSSSGGGHGTHVAGSISGQNPGLSIDCEAGTLIGPSGDLDGTAPGAHLIAQEMGESLAYVNDLGGGVYHAATVAYSNGARIHSNSWGGSCCLLGVLCIAPLLCTPSYDEFARDADEVTWEFPDLLIAVAAGNNGTCCASAGGAVGSPGMAKSPLTVGASGAGAAGENVASFSSRGPIFDRRTKPDLLAQGDGIVSTASNGDINTPGCATCSMSGTSMATPTAAGLAALAREYLVRGYYPSGSEQADDAQPAPSAALLKGMLINGAREMTGTGAGSAIPNQVEGWGRLHLDDVLYFNGDSRQLWLADATAGVETNQTDSYVITVSNAGEPLKITLVWSDYPAALNANPHIVNRLRLEVEDPDGAVWTQKLPSSGTPNPTQSTDTSGHDDRNPVHQIHFTAPVVGLYQIRVIGIDVPMGKPGQPYALVATGMFDEFEPPAEIDLSMEKTASVESIGVAEPFVYTLQVAADLDGATQVQVTDQLPAGLCVTDIDAAPWNCHLDGGDLSCTQAGPVIGEFAPIHLTVLAPKAAGTIQNIATVVSSFEDPDDDNNHDVAEVDVIDAISDRIFADDFEAEPECL